MPSQDSQAILPSDVDEHVGPFDRFASIASGLCSRASFFVLCVAMVVIWGPSYWLFTDSDTWQLVINTATTVVTFLIVALLKNSETRADQAVQHKLNAIAFALVDLMEERGLDEDAEELNAAIGLEHRETSK